MALIKCPECGNQVSDKAIECPNCGYPIGGVETAQEQMYEEESPKKKWWILPLVITLLCLLAGGGYYLFTRNSHGADDSVTEKKDSISSNNAIVELTPEFVDALDVYDELSSFSEGYAAVRRGKKWGYINTKGEEVIACSYDYADVFSEGLAAVCKNEKYGYIDTTGKTIIPFTFDNMPKPFCEGLAAVRIDDTWGWIDKNGEVAIPFTIQAEEVGNFSEGLAFVYREGYGDDSEFSFIDKNGTEVFSGKMNGEFYLSGYRGSIEPNDFPSFHDGVVYVPDTDSSADNFVKYDKQGNKLQTISLDKLPYLQKYYSEDYSLGVKKGNEILIPAKYDLIGSEFGNLVQSSNGVVLVGLYEYGDEEEVIVHYGYADLKGNDTFSSEQKDRWTQSKSAAMQSYDEESIETNEYDSSIASDEYYSADSGSSSAPQWVQGTWKHDLTAPMVGIVASYTLVISGNTMTFYRNGEMQYQDNFTYQNGRLVGQHGSFILNEDAQRIADETGRYDKVGGSGSYSSENTRFSTAYDVIGYLSGRTFRETDYGGSLQIRQDGCYVNGRCMTGAPSVSNFTSTSAVVRATLIPSGTITFYVDAQRNTITDSNGNKYQ